MRSIAALFESSRLLQNDNSPIKRYYWHIYLDVLPPKQHLHYFVMSVCGCNEERRDSMVGGHPLAGRAPIHLDVCPPQQEFHNLDAVVLTRHKKRGGSRVCPSVHLD